MAASSRWCRRAVSIAAALCAGAALAQEAEPPAEPAPPPPPAQARAAPPSNAPRLRFAVLFPHNTLGGEMKGDLILYSSETAMAVPELDPDYGLGFALGVRDRTSAVEVSRQRWGSTAHFAGAAGDARLTVWTLDWKLYPMEGWFQPYLLLSHIPYASLVLEDGAVSLTGSEDVGDATFIGVFGGWQVGGGVELFATRWAAVHAQLAYRWLKFERAKGTDDEFLDIEDGLKADSWNFLFGVTFQAP